MRKRCRNYCLLLPMLLLTGFVIACSGTAAARDPERLGSNAQNRADPGATEQAEPSGVATLRHVSPSTAVDPTAAALVAAGPTVAYLPMVTTTVAAPPPTAVPPSPTPVVRDPVVVAVGDIADCGVEGDEATASLVTDPSATLITLGDTVYESGTADEFLRCYDPAWGVFKARTRPAVGNHEYLTPGAAGYFGYFGQAAGDPDKGYYSFDLGAWHVVVLNSNCSQVAGCQDSSPQVAWLRADLAAHPTRCTMAVWHHPMFGSTGTYTDHLDMRTIWSILYNAGAELVLAGHAHNYERMAPQDAAGQRDSNRGLRQFIVGTGGKSSQAFETIAVNSEVRNDTTHGVLKLTLRDQAYDWQFIPEAGGTFEDAGTGSCH